MSWARRYFDALIVLSVLGVISWVVLWDGCFGAVSWTADSFQYLRAAQNLWRGEWMPVWPCGYPAVIAVVAKSFGLDVFVASKALGVLSSAAILWMFWRYARAAFSILALSLLNPAYLKIFRGTLSESLFIPLLLAMMFVPKRTLPLSLIFVSLFLVRYIGIFAPFWLASGMWFSGRRDRRDWRSFLVASLVAWSFAAAYLGFNYLNCGAVTGMGRDTLRVPFRTLLRDVCAAEFHEFQAFGLVLFWWAALFVLGRGRTPSRADASTRSQPPPPSPPFPICGSLSFIYAGLAYHFTVLAMRLYGACSGLGFRFLYPGTILIAIGLVLRSAKRGDCDFHGLTVPRMTGIVVLAIGVGVNLLDAELWVRRICGIETYQIGRPYLEVKSRLLEKYRCSKSGDTVRLKGLCDEDLPIVFLRPDLKYDFPEGARRH